MVMTPKQSTGNKEYGGINLIFPVIQGKSEPFVDDKSIIRKSSVLRSKIINLVLSKQY